MNDVRDGLLLLEMDENSLEKYTYSLEDIRNVVIYALSESVSNYWPELALRWLQKKPEYIDSDILYWIENSGLIGHRAINDNIFASLLLSEGNSIFKS